MNKNLFKNVGIVWLLSFSHISLANINQILSIHVCPSLNYMRIVVESVYPLKYKYFILKKPERLVVDFTNTDPSFTLKNISSQTYKNNYYIQSFRIRKFNSRTIRIVFNLQSNIKSQLFNLPTNVGLNKYLIINFYSENSIYLQDPILAFIEVYKQYELKSKMFFNTKKNTRLSKNSNNNKNRLITVMLDPGHGGEDSGAIGKHHTREKDVVLQIARRLKILAENENNIKVHITRNDDTSISLEERIAKAQKHCVDLFISIHADAFINSRPSGSSVFTFSTKNSTSVIAQYIAKTQNSSNITEGISKSGDKYLDYTILDMMQSLTISNSLKFGKIILRKISKINKLHRNNVEQANFAVLRSPDIPSILIETAFISNVKEESKLKTVKFQQEIAESILEGIKAYLADSPIAINRLCNSK